MDRSQISTLLEPVSADDPCGPDLDLAGDADFFNALAGAESLLPGQFFQQDGDDLRPYPPGSRDFEPRITELLNQLKRSRDIRLVVILAKYAILDRKLPEFVEAVELIAKLLETYWDEVNPKGEGGIFALRVAALQALDDRPHVILPLQFTPLIRHPRSGVVTWRSKALADGAEPAEGETFPGAAELREAFATVEVAQVVDRRDCFGRLVAALEIIHSATTERLGHAEAADLPLVLGLSRDILAFLDAIVGAREPSAAPTPSMVTVGAERMGDATRSAASGLADVAAVAASLAGVAAYFERFEPSSPALLLVRNAERLVGKTFAEVMRILLPDHVDAATIEIGGRQTFAVPVSRLAEGAAEPSEEAAPSAPAIVADRLAALSELRKIEAFYAEREPTSPVPFFCERARKFAVQDFLSILKEILPEDALKTLDAG
ncbi:type VI secretion system ImpA family N-terminal domain-containing protein [Rhodoblastus acidophilus]|uniref:Type VI secretion system ImpA family N-terminal domain-containing protein n=1 Tax=Candidatus Rhodoblastus alkanivorans TaxID=2954117 RepID=A0ABS9Z788_9HYPH|nr:type VI secretion system ImpA family N-terminal domain-containing protein [Candidatus Rhodoblastus alkanivorans]MCI4678276.1 type VI secretion system ImpA family N-terminal domain-containing protein [Candidatus Rhodoblastus alkanivorans]MCI4683534.1 type VI secretion system ImpA family N-terminal domain-containing protein [Candidatus Rhodoblastus alkanivorans]MDI4640849.1 type VI secretion system ImpA family N-terminal domain-containing protein [Rhodoblastus acidophilus]